MSQTIAFCEERAKEAVEEARNATLENVRERALRSAAAWRDMADRAIQIEKAREDKRRQKEEEASDS